MGVCGNHWKWLQLRACKTWWKSVRKHLFRDHIILFLIFLEKVLLRLSALRAPPRWDHSLSGSARRTEGGGGFVCYRLFRRPPCESCQLARTTASAAARNYYVTVRNSHPFEIASESPPKAPCPPKSPNSPKNRTASSPPVFTF